MTPHEPPSLLLEVERADVPDGVYDPVERATWGGLRVEVAGRTVTSFWLSDGERVSPRVFLPLVHLADWMTRNWWALLHEPFRGEESRLRNGDIHTLDRNWVARHSLRASDSATYPPNLFFYSNGPRVSAVWREDRDETRRERYLGTGAVSLERELLSAAMGGFVETILRWCGDLPDARIKNLRLNWDAINATTPDEYPFCTAAGTLGLDPYDTARWPEHLADFLAGDFGDQSGQPLAGDFLEAAEPATAPALWEWICHGQATFGLAGHPPPWATPSTARAARDAGYALAHRFRKAAGVGDNGPVSDLSALIQAAGGFRLRFETYNHVPSDGVSAIVGWTDHASAVVAGPDCKREDSRRFLEARGLYQALTGCTSGARLLTGASTWEQQAARAFAAELLAPMAALGAGFRADTDETGWDDQIHTLAEQYGVSARLVQNQLWNAGVRA